LRTLALMTARCLQAPCSIGSYILDAVRIDLDVELVAYIIGGQLVLHPIREH
jgi:hypothetical protein